MSRVGKFTIFAVLPSEMIARSLNKKSSLSLSKIILRSLSKKSSLSKIIARILNKKSSSSKMIRKKLEEGVVAIKDRRKKLQQDVAAIKDDWKKLELQNSELKNDNAGLIRDINAMTTKQSTLEHEHQVLLLKMKRMSEEEAKVLQNVRVEALTLRMASYMCNGHPSFYIRFIQTSGALVLIACLYMGSIISIFAVLAVVIKGIDMAQPLFGKLSDISSLQRAAGNFKDEIAQLQTGKATLEANLSDLLKRRLELADQCEEFDQTIIDLRGLEHDVKKRQATLDHAEAVFVDEMQCERKKLEREAEAVKKSQLDFANEMQCERKKHQRGAEALKKSQLDFANEMECERQKLADFVLDYKLIQACAEDLCKGLTAVAEQANHAVTLPEWLSFLRSIVCLRRKTTLHLQMARLLQPFLTRTRSVLSPPVQPIGFLSIHVTSLMSRAQDMLRASSHARTGACQCMASAIVTNVYIINNRHIRAEYEKTRLCIREMLRNGVAVHPAVSLHVHNAFPEINLDPSVNEELLFHGTQHANAIAIYGFDERCARSGLYGKGVYFAEQACKSHQYTGRSGEHCIILSRVILGDPFYPSDSSNVHRNTKPPLKTCGGLHNSVIANPGTRRSGGFQDHRELIVYSGAQACPEVIIHYSVGR